MKLKSILYVLMMGVLMTFASCSDDDKPTSTHTDASKLVEGTFKGIIVDPKTEKTFCDDAVISFTRIDADTIQAVTLHLTSVAKNLDLEAVVNPAKAGNSFSFSCGNKYPKLAGRLIGDKLTFVIPLNKSGKAFSNAATAVSYNFTGDRQ